MKTDSHHPFGQRLFHLLCFAGILLLYIFIITVTGIGCPIRWFTGVSCPGCGMSRALFCLLQGDIRGSLSCHPLILPAILLVLYLFLAPDDTAGQKKQKKAASVIGVVLLVLVYVLRILRQDPLVTIDPANGAMLQYLQFCRKIVTSIR